MPMPEETRRLAGSVVQQEPIGSSPAALSLPQEPHIWPLILLFCTWRASQRHFNMLNTCSGDRIATLLQAVGKNIQHFCFWGFLLASHQHFSPIVKDKSQTYGFPCPFLEDQTRKETYSFASMSWKKGQMLAGCAINYREAKRDSLHTCIIKLPWSKTRLITYQTHYSIYYAERQCASATNTMDGIFSSPSPASISHPKKVPTATLLSYQHHSCTLGHVPMWLPNRNTAVEGGW